MNLLPHPRRLKREAGSFQLPKRTGLHLDASLPGELAGAITKRLQSTAQELGVAIVPDSGNPVRTGIICRPSPRTALPQNPEAYRLLISRSGVVVEYCKPPGLRAAVATLRQLLREFGRRLPCLRISDWPDFPRRGVMLDVSRGRVPKLATLFELVEQLADFKINEFQLYTEHTFAYRKHRSVWRPWSALTAAEIQKLDARCGELGIDLVPNQNSFGHLRYWLAHPPLAKLGEVREPYEAAGGAFLRYPSTLAPNHPGTLPFLRELYDELLPNFSSDRFNVGCDETWDLGRGQSRKLCARKGKGRVYLDFLEKIRREVSARGRRMMFWGDIVLHYPKLIRELTPRKQTLIALNWGYEARHPFNREAARFARSKIPFYVCPGTSTWMTLIGRLDNALANLRNAAAAGRRHGAIGFLITDWGDGGHPQPLAVSWMPYLAGASLAWCARSFEENKLQPVLNRDIFHDPSGRAAKAAFMLGTAHRKLGCTEPNLTPLGAVIAAPRPETRELFCYKGLKYYARISPASIHRTLREIETGRAWLRRALPRTQAGKLLGLELDLAARMAVQSCRIMLWQQALAAERISKARGLARAGGDELARLERDFAAYWRLRNKGTPRNCSPFLRWRRDDYRRGILHFPPHLAHGNSRRPS